MAPLLPVIENDLGLTHGEAGSFFLIISIGYSSALLGSGFLSSRLTHRKTIIVSSIAIGCTLIAFSRILVVFVALLSGWISDRLGPSLTIKGVLVFNGLMTFLLGIAPGNWILVIIFLQPMLSVCFFPAGFTILSKITSPSFRNIIVSLTIFFAYLIGAGIIPAIMGIMGESDHFDLAISLVGMFTMISVFFVRYLTFSDVNK